MNDKYGFDPLRHPVLNLAQDGSESLVTVRPYEEHNPQVIAKRFYGVHSRADVLLAHNGLVHQCEVKAGMILRVPVVAVTQRKTTKVFEL